MKLFLLGMMGSGKSYLAQKLSALYDIDWIDLDAEIEKESMITIKEIFEVEGEDFFRNKEQQVLHNLSHKKNIIIATGGGTPCFHDNMKWMNENGITIWIDEDINVLAERLKTEKSHRPLIKDLDDDELKDYLSSKLKERFPFYSQSQYHVSGKNISEKNFIEILDKHA